MAWIKENWIALLALIMSATSLIIAVQLALVSRRQAGLHIVPVIVTRFDDPREGNPVVAISNEGDLPVAALSANIRIFVYNKKTKKVVSHATQGQTFSHGAMFRAELNPTEYVSQELIGVEPRADQIILYEISVHYLRPSDMMVFDRRELFFVEDSGVRGYDEFRSSEHYSSIMSEAASVEMPEPKKWDPGLLKRLLDAQETP